MVLVTAISRNPKEKKAGLPNLVALSLAQNLVEDEGVHNMWSDRLSDAWKGTQTVEQQSGLVFPVR